MSNVRDILAAGRVANLPTVWSNILCGLMLYFLVDRTHTNSSFAFPLIITSLCGSLLYLAGCFFNDYYDRDWDRQHKPDRAIPAGRISAKLLLTLTLICAALGILLSLSLGKPALIVALLILLFIVIYTIIHKKTAFGVLPMGVCRMLLYALGFFTLFDTESEGVLYLFGAVFSGTILLYFYIWFLAILAPPFGLLSYIAGLTLIARSEAKGTLSKKYTILGLTLLGAPFLTHLLPAAMITLASDLNEESVGQFMLILSLAFSIPLLTWLINGWRRLKSGEIGNFVSICLSGVCLLDFIFVGAIGVCSGNFALALVCPVFFALSLILQKIAPAT